MDRVTKNGLNYECRDCGRVGREAPTCERCDPDFWEGVEVMEMDEGPQPDEGDGGA